MLLLIDNHDSFTYNVAQYFRELGQDVRVEKSDAITVADIEAMAPDRLVISPGPCTPAQSGVSIPAIHAFMARLPILGICLGHQCIAQALGGRIVRAPQIVHGKTSAIYHNGLGVFKDLPSPYLATRYHSLVADWQTLPSCLSVSAWTQNAGGEQEFVMGFKHQSLPLQGVQFHPESILSEHGHSLFNNFLQAP